MLNVVVDLYNQVENLWGNIENCMHTSRSSSVNWSLTISISLGGNSRSGLPSNVEFFVRRRRIGFKMACALEPDYHEVRVE